MRVALDEADRILIETVERAVEVGVGRTFTTQAGQTVRVLDVNERWVSIEAMVAGLVEGEALTLPRNARRVAWSVAKLRAIARAQAR